MKKKSPLVKTLCLKYCSYFKADKNENLACRGYHVVERLMLAGRTTIMEKTDVSADTKVMDQLVQALCDACPFHENDCDFFQDLASKPCGGFILLSQLLGTGRITIDEIK
jgi:hypothetical protein